MSKKSVSRFVSVMVMGALLGFGTNFVAAFQKPGGTVIFKTITIGVYKSVGAYREALTKAGFWDRDRFSGDILNKIQVSQGQVELDLVVRSVAELGFEKATRLDQIYARGKKLGLELCPPEVGPALRLAYPDQPNGQVLRIAMKPISSSVTGLFYMFGLGCWGSLDLTSFLSSLNDPWGPGSRFVFVLPRK